jgi:hypothetical protein
MALVLMFQKASKILALTRDDRALAILLGLLPDDVKDNPLGIPKALALLGTLDFFTILIIE